MADRRHPLAPLPEALGRRLARTGISPDAITLIALAVSAGAAWLLYKQFYVAGSLVLVFGAGMDSLDGAVARAAGKTTRAGGYLDSLMDRYVDFLVLFAIMAGVDETRMWVAGSLAVFGTLLTSGARWRVHEDLHPSAKDWGRDLIERTERYLILIPGIFAQGLFDHYGNDLPILFAVVALLAVVSNVTVMQRIRKALRLLDAEDRRTKGT